MLRKLQLEYLVIMTAVEHTMIFMTVQVNYNLTICIIMTSVEHKMIFITSVQADYYFCQL